MAVVVPPSTFLLDDRVFLSLGPIQIATNVRDHAGWEVEVVDLTGHHRRCAKPTHDDADCDAEVWAHAAQRIAACAADVWGVYAMSCHVRSAVRIRELITAHDSRAVVVAGGPHASLQPTDFERKGFDAVVMAQTGGGCGEAPTLDLLADFAKGAMQRRYENLQVARDDPSRWSWPDRTLVDHASYDYRMRGLRATSIVTAFGCPYSCTFCSHGPGYTRLRLRAMDHVATELNVIKTLGYQATMLYDDEVNISQKHFAALCDVLRSSGLKWRAFIKSNLFSEDQAKLAAESGAVELCTGGETMDPDMKKAILKKSTVQDDTDFVRWCMDHGIAAKVFTMVGLPGETRATVATLKRWLLDRVAEAQARGTPELFHNDVTLYSPFPGTPLFGAPEKHGLKVLQPIDYAEEDVVYKGRPGEYRSYTETQGLTAAELVALRDEVERDVNAAAGRKGIVVGVETKGGESGSRSSSASYEEIRRIDGG